MFSIIRLAKNEKMIERMKDARKEIDNREYMENQSVCDDRKLLKFRDTNERDLTLLSIRFKLLEQKIR